MASSPLTPRQHWGFTPYVVQNSSTRAVRFGADRPSKQLVPEADAKEGRAAVEYRADHVEAIVEVRRVAGAGRDDDAVRPELLDVGVGRAVGHDRDVGAAADERADDVPLHPAIDDDDVRIRLRHESDEKHERTIVEADFNRDSTYETTITIEGRHLLVIVEHA